MTRRGRGAGLPRVVAGRCLWAVAMMALLAASAVAQPGGDFRTLLTDAGVGEDAFTQLAEIDDELTDEQAAIIGKVLFRLDQLDRGQIRSLGTDGAMVIERFPEDMAPLAAGTLVRMGGSATSARPIAGPADGVPLWRCEVQLSDGGAATVISARVPQAWRDREELREPVKLLGVVAGVSADADPRQFTVLTNRLAWYPTTGMPTGVAWLTAHGFDAALLDEVRPASPFSKPSDSREAEAFYSCIATVRRGNVGELWRLARQEVSDAVERWQSAATAAGAERKELAAQMVDASPGDRPELELQILALRRRQAVAAAVERRAAKGASSVGPLFVAPADSIGRLVLLEGTARRAVRVIVDDKSAPPDLGEYYELDVFTADSENLPVICCATSLPAGFPTGDRINEPIRIAGVFFKRWTYARRTGADDEEPRMPQRMAAPLVIAAQPEWLRPAAGGVSPGRGLAIGAVFVAALAAVWIAVARTARRDRLARLSRSGYDADLGPLAESRDAAEP